LKLFKTKQLSSEFISSAEKPAVIYGIILAESALAANLQVILKPFGIERLFFNNLFHLVYFFYL